MKQRTIDITEHSRAGTDAVFALLADGTTWPRWSPIESFDLERTGDPPPEGVGAIRVFRRGRTTGRDEIVELIAGRRLGYASLSGLPVRDYRGQVDIEPTARGTTIRWRASFTPKFPGTGGLLERGVRDFLGQCAHGLAEYAAVQVSR